ncbi:hypothetical protein HZA97_02665 [Candidatus Woesearchaeota archaeon]|nr:hypothetical protein [Candidatus Woesearchaeota archaeon]
MVNASIIEYLKKYKDQYDISTLRSYLIQRGYNPSDVEQAIRVVTRQKRSFSIKYVLVMLVALLILSSAYFFWPSQKLELFLELSPEKTTIQKAENFVFSVSLGTNQEKEVEAKFDYVLFDDKNNKLLEEFNYVRLKKFKKMNFPLDTKNLVPGSYSLKFFFSFESKEISDSFNFEVKQGSSQKNSTVPEISCPYSCNDNNPYTKDECVNNKCVNTPENNPANTSVSTPPKTQTTTKDACGNGVCDANESTLSCSQDCAPEKVITSEDLSQKALQLAKSNPEEAANTCLQLTVGYDECLKKLNEQTNNADFCNAVINSKIKDDCYSDHAMRINDFNVCSLIVNSLKQRACLNLKKLG